MDAGGLQTLVSVMSANSQSPDVQIVCLSSLANMCAGDETVTTAARREAGYEAGVLEAAVEAMRAFPRSSGVQHYGITAITSVCSGQVYNLTNVAARREHAVDVAHTRGRCCQFGRGRWRAK